MRRKARHDVPVFRGGRFAPSGAQDPPDGRVADLVTEPGQLAVHSAVSPGRVLLRQSQRKLAYFLADPGSAWPAGIRPLALDQPAVPGQYGAWRDEPMGAQYRRHPPGWRRQDRPVGPVQLRPRDLTPQHRDFVAEDMISASLEHWLRPSSISQPKTRIMNR